jgi:hypothetical protein
MGRPTQSMTFQSAIPGQSTMTNQSEKTVERLNWRTLIEAKPETSAETIAALDDYFQHFVQVPIDEKDGKREIKPQNCIKCDEPLTGFMAVLVGKGGFTWGLAHGEGHCAHCRWPARGHHFIKDKDGKEIVTLRNFILQVHPDFVTDRNAA